ELAHVNYERAIDCTEDLRYSGKSVQNLLNDLKKRSYHGYMSAMIIRKSLLDPLIPKYSSPGFPLYDTTWLPLALFYEAIENRTGLFVCEPVVLNRDNPRPSGKKYWDYFYLERIMALEYLEEAGYDEERIRGVIKSRLLDIVFLGIMAKGEYESSHLLNGYIKQNDSIPLYNKIVVQILDLVPTSLMKLMRGVVLRVKESKTH
ncbi:MAG: hypothetical protein ACP5OC_09080, partial [Thermoplasmata archaeon]